MRKLSRKKGSGLGHKNLLDEAPSAMRQSPVMTTRAFYKNAVFGNSRCANWYLVLVNRNWCQKMLPIYVYKIGYFWAYSHFFCFWGPFFENFEPKICLFIWDEISQMTDLCHKWTKNGTFKFGQKRNCPPSKARWGRGRGQICPHRL